ncbi:MAG: glucose-1-phosphate adenylyltransferase [Limisphaerales bacterium]|jgi:glucose-1-phosphate adenylyltransferase
MPLVRRRSGVYKRVEPNRKKGMPMPQSERSNVNNKNVLSVIMGGGAGTRLYPLTHERSKPAVPLAGKYRLVDIPISNCINSGLRRMYLLTQFNSASLHRHISSAYKFDHFAGGFVEILAAEQTPTTQSWYQGTADAVRKNLIHFLNNDFEYILILSGDQLYRMDFREIVEAHIQSKAEVTIATLPVERKPAGSLGIMQMDETNRITRFVEKPQEAETLDSLRIDPEWYGKLNIPEDREELFLASMGIYVFNRETLIELLDNDHTDFGKHIIPGAIKERQVFSHVFQGYWEDIGTIASFFEANLDAASDLPKFDFYNMEAPIFTHPRFLPASKINGAQIDHAVISDGCIINNAKITHSLVGIRSFIGAGTELNRVITFGGDAYESEESIRKAQADGRPRIGIGENCCIQNAIIDKNARIGNNVVISPEGKEENVDHKLYYIRDGIVVIPKNAVIPDGTRI